MLVHTQTLITQLVFNHALRVRVKAETASSPTPSTASSTATSPDTGSVAGDSEDSESESEDETAVSETTSTTKASRGLASRPQSVRGGSKGADPPVEEEQKGGNFVGKLNNLVTTDLSNLVEGRDFLFVGAFFRYGCRRCGSVRYSLQCCIFLSRSASVYGSYTRSSAGGQRQFPPDTQRNADVVSSALVGMIVILVMFPLPGYIARVIQRIQVERMKKVWSLSYYL